MTRLGRLIALPLVLLALAAQGLAPLSAAAAPRGPFGLPICSASDLGVGQHGQNPLHGSAHDCCAGACCFISLATPPPFPALGERIAFAAAVIQASPLAKAAPLVSPRRLPPARGPPTALSAI
ncbi:MAG: hypothetical protein ACREEW_10355 [Caulobacteraceae bacterium]